LIISFFMMSSLVKNLDDKDHSNPVSSLARGLRYHRFSGLNVKTMSKLLMILKQGNFSPS